MEYIIESKHALPIVPRTSRNTDKEAPPVLMEDGSIKPFHMFDTSTRTAVVVTNCSLHLDKLFTYIPIAQYEPVKKQRGRKKRINIERPTPKLPFGSVVYAQYESKARGVRLRPTSTANKKQTSSQANVLQTQKTSESSFFKHCVMLDIMIDRDEQAFGENNSKNIKLYSNGTMHITGCKHDDHYQDLVVAVFQLFNIIRTYTGEEVVVRRPEKCTAVFNTVMQNINFFMGFGIYRDLLDDFIQEHFPNYCSGYEGSVNTSVNIKIPINPDNVPKNHQLMQLTYDLTNDTYSRSRVPYEEVKHMFQKKGKRKDKEHTFLVFASGLVILTSPGDDMEHAFYQFVHTLLTNRAQFEEKLAG